MKAAQFLVIFSLFLAVIPGCKNNQASSPVSQPAKVTTTAAYEKAFGPVPTVDKGTACAFVIYFPSEKEPSKIIPVPFFTFDEASLKKVATEQLLNGMDTGSYKGELLTLPTGIRIVSLNDEKGVVTLTLNKEFSNKQKNDNFANAITATLMQFKGVSTVRILVDGNSQPLKVSVDKDTILEPGPPRLLSVAFANDTEKHGKMDLNNVQMKKLHAMMPMFFVASAKLETGIEKGDAATVEAEATKIATALPDLKKSKPHKNSRHRKDFVKLAIQLDATLASTVMMAKNGDFAGARAAFKKVEQTCAACHAAFRD